MRARVNPVRSFGSQHHFNIQMWYDLRLQDLPVRMYVSMKKKYALNVIQLILKINILQQEGI